MVARTLLALLLLTACSKPTEVELRLYPCGMPEEVDLDIQGYDGGGNPLALLQKSFGIADPGVFGDKYATVGLNKPDGMVTADFTLTWHLAGGALEVVMLAGKKVPDAGEVLELGADECMPVGGTTAMTGEPTSTGTSTSTSTGPASTSTGDDTTGSTGMSTGVMSTTDASTTSTTSTTETTETTTGDMTTGESILNTPCDPDDPQGAFYCEGSEPGKIGYLLECAVDHWVESNCSVMNCEMIQFQQPVAVGCSGTGFDFACVCQEMTLIQDCVMADQGCDMDMMTITLCHDDKIAKTVCAMCYETQMDLPICGPS